MIEALAWLVYCKPGEEFDYLVFANKDEAEWELDGRAQEAIDKGDDEPVIIPLYPANAT